MCETPSNQNVEEWLVEEGGFSHQYAYEVSQNITDNELRAGVCNILEGGNRFESGGWCFLAKAAFSCSCHCGSVACISSKCALKCENVKGCEGTRAGENCFPDHRCDNERPTFYREGSVPVPKMLLESCSFGDFDFFRFQDCATQTILVNSCSAQASACRLSHPRRSFGDFAFFSYVLLPVASFVGWLFTLLLSSACFGECFLTSTVEDRALRKAIRRRSKKLEREMSQHEATFKERTRAYFALAIFFFDLASDGSCLVQFVTTGQPEFAAAQAVVVLIAAASELWKGNPKDFLDAFKGFLKAGVPSDRFLSILQAEQSFEAPLSFMLQFYSAFFTSGSEFAFGNLCFSISMSLYGISKGVYENLHLNMEDAVEAAEELTDSEPTTPQAQLVGSHQALAAAPASRLPPPPGLSPVMAMAVTQLPPPGPLQLGGRVKDTE